MSNKILKPNKLKFGEIFIQVRNYLAEVYNQTGDIFTAASPYGQILVVMQNFVQLIFLYLEDSLVELNINTASKTRSIYGFSRLAGHNPTRAICAEGTIIIKWKPSISEVNFSYATIQDKAILTCDYNGYNYVVRISNDMEAIRLKKSDRSLIPLKIIQGDLEEQVKIGTGLELQSFSIIGKKPIDNENVKIYVNGEPYDIVDSLYDMVKGGKQCLVKTGITDGIDIYFGNQDFGTIPERGANIKVEYMTTEGFSGNIFGRTSDVTWKWLEPVYTNTGDELDLNEYIDISIDKPIVLGADGESPDLTKLIAPKTSRALVLANTENYVNFFSRFNYSYVDAYTTLDDEYIDDNNIIYMFLIPDISRRLQKNADYFTTNLVNFYLDAEEKAALYRYVNQSGQQIVSTELSIIDPILTRYVVNVFLRIYDTANPSTISNEVTKQITEYLLKVKRRDKIPKSDLIAILENIIGVDSVNISFISEGNEKAIIDGYYYKQVETFDAIRGIKTVQQVKVMVPENTDPNLGLDDFGDVVIGKNEMPVMRGGWYDRFGNYFEDGLSDTTYSSVNIIVKEVIKETIAIKQMNAKKNAIK
jgi:hypothetical protein